MVTGNSPHLQIRHNLSVLLLADWKWLHPIVFVITLNTLCITMAGPWAITQVCSIHICMVQCTHLITTGGTPHLYNRGSSIAQRLLQSFGLGLAGRLSLCFATLHSEVIAVREMSGRNKISQGQGIVREFYKVSGKFWHLAKLMKNVMEFHIISGKMTILGSMIDSPVTIYINQLAKSRHRNFLK